MIFLKGLFYFIYVLMNAHKLIIEARKLDVFELSTPDAKKKKETGLQ